MSTKTIHLLFSFIIIFHQTFFAQDLDLKWSTKMEYDNMKDGFFSHFINTNESYIYGLNTNLALKPSKTDDKLKLLAYDKVTMKQVASVSLRGFKENASSKEQYKELDYYSTHIFDNKVLVFWKKKVITKTEKKEELYVESFDINLKRDGKLKKIYSSNFSDDVKLSRFSSTSMVVLANKEAGDDIIVGSELPKRGDNVIFKYLVLNSELETSDENEVELPIKLIGKSYGLSSNYTYGKDGNIYVQSTVSLTREERKNAKKGEDLSYCVFSVINTDNKEATTFELRDNNKTINDFSYVITGNKIRIYGFFGDLLKDATGNSTHGLFYSEIDSKTLEGTGMNYTYFDKKLIDQIFVKDKEDKKRTAALSKKKRDKAKANDEESLDTRFVIENMISVDDNNVVLMCSKMYNYSRTVCTSSPNGGRTCTTYYYCEKSNVLGIKISNEGEIVWASNLDRKFTFNTWNVFDVKTVYKDNKFYVIYTSAYDTDAEVKNGRSRKKMSEYRDNFEYAVFDGESGKFEKNTFMVNKADTPKKERKFVSSPSIKVFDDQFYVDYKITRQKVGWCIANVLCFPTLYYSMLSGDTKHGYGNLGVISVIEDGGGKKNKKKKAK